MTAYLIRAGKKTAARYMLECWEKLYPLGDIINNNDYQTARALRAAGLAQQLPTGPRGGTRLHITDRGRQALSENWLTMDNPPTLADLVKEALR